MEGGRWLANDFENDGEIAGLADGDWGWRWRIEKAEFLKRSLKP